MDYLTPIYPVNVPMDGCKCGMCEAERAKAERPRTYSIPIVGNPFRQAVSEMFDSLSKAPAVVPFEPAQPEPVYTHVLLPYYEFGEPITDAAELHTAESLIDAMSTQQANGYGFKVYKLGECVFTIDPSDNSE